MGQMNMVSQSNAASPIMGLNDNLEFLGKVLHVQTENVWSAKPCILTQVFHGGRVVLTRKYEYASNLEESENYKKIQALMYFQHSKVIEKINSQQAKIIK
jgi:hypothetical protein